MKAWICLRLCTVSLLGLQGNLSLENVFLGDWSKWRFGLVECTYPPFQSGFEGKPKGRPVARLHKVNRPLDLTLVKFWGSLGEVSLRRGDV